MENRKGQSQRIGEGPELSIKRVRRIMVRRHPVDAHRQNLEVFVLNLFEQPLHGGHFLFTGRAPGGPDIEKNHLPPVVGKGSRSPFQVVSEELWSHASHHDGVDLVLRQPRNKNHQPDPKGHPEQRISISPGSSSRPPVAFTTLPHQGVDSPQR